MFTYLFVTFKIFISLANAISQHHTQHVCSLHWFFNTCCFWTQPMCSISSDNETLKICLCEKSSVWVVAIGCDPKAIWHWTDLTVFIRDFLVEMEMANVECASLPSWMSLENQSHTGHNVISTFCKSHQYLLNDHRSECVVL